MTKFSEDLSVEVPAMKIFEELGWETLNCYEEKYGQRGTLGRETRSEVVLVKRLKKALQKLNPKLAEEVLNLAIEEIIHDRSTMTMAGANRFIHRLLKDGVKVEFSGASGERKTETVRVIDWKNPLNNNFLLAQQFWITGELYTKRTDLLGFVNGIPIVFIELKASHAKIKDAFDNNLTDYKDTIPHLFWYNGLVILSNGMDARIGSLTSGWEHFSNWKKIDSRGTRGIVPLETMIRGVCEKTKLLDILESFTLFSQTGSGLIKLIAKNHQYLGVNSALDAVHSIKAKKGKLGVFWHTQGSGKSVSMMFLSQKVLRKIPGGWTFLIVTDRNELDDQIYKNFADAEVVTEPKRQVRAKSRKHLKQLLNEDHRYVFTTLQKFFEEKNTQYPKLTDRSDIIVITDEAHRSQYDAYALNMRNALPKASFIGFTGTPLIKGDNVTHEVFGDYVSVYDFKESIEDEATVPLYYENRIPEVQLKKDETRVEFSFKSTTSKSIKYDTAFLNKLDGDYDWEFNCLYFDTNNKNFIRPSNHVERWEKYVSFTKMLVKRTLWKNEETIVISDYQRRPKGSNKKIEFVEQDIDKVYNILQTESHGVLPVQMADMLPVGKNKFNCWEVNWGKSSRIERV